MPVVEYPDKVGVMVKKTDAESGNFVKGAGFAVFSDAGCTQRVSVEGDGKEEVPVFYYDEDLDVAASAKFVKMQDKYYVKEVVIPDGYRDDGKVWEVAPDYGEISDFSAENTPIRCDVRNCPGPLTGCMRQRPLFTRMGVARSLMQEVTTLPARRGRILCQQACRQKRMPCLPR